MMRRLRVILSSFLVCLLLSLVLSSAQAVITPLWITEPSSDNGSTIVYITKTGKKYHTANCRYLYESKIEITLFEAVQQGYTRCSRCNPPVYSGELPEPTETMTESVHHGSSGGTWHGSGSSSRHSYSGNYGSSSSSYSGSSSGSTISRSDSSLKTENDSASNIDLSDILNYCFLLFILAFVLLCVVIRIISDISAHFDAKKEEQQRLLQERKDQFDKNSNYFYSLKDDFFSSYIHFFLSFFYPKHDIPSELATRRNRLNQILSVHKAYIKDGVVFGYHGKGYGSHCTVYFSEYSPCYHLDFCQYCGPLYTHITTPPKRKRPCLFCHPERIKTDWISEALQLSQEIEILEDYARMHSEELEDIIFSIADHLRKVEKLEVHADPQYLSATVSVAPEPTEETKSDPNSCQSTESEASK